MASFQASLGLYLLSPLLSRVAIVSYLLWSVKGYLAQCVPKNSGSYQPHTTLSAKRPLEM